MLHHLSLGVSDMARATRFYDAVLAPLGQGRVWEDLRPGQSGQAVGYGPPGGGDKLAIKQADAGQSAPGPGFHLAFAAPDRDAVDRFHAAALAGGGQDNGPPGLRPHYGADYYAAFVIDPDGHRLEAVCKLNGIRQPAAGQAQDSPLTWSETLDGIDWNALESLYRRAPLGNKSAADLKTVFTNSRFRCFVFDGGALVAAGRALADGADASYICDVAVLPTHQGAGLGRQVVSRLVAASQGHKKILLYSVPGKEGFYRKLGFLPMLTAMAIFEDPARAIARGHLRGD